MDKDKTIRKGIIASVIASVIFMIVLEPLMKILWSFFNNTSNKIYNSYLDSIFTNAAIGHRNHLDFMTYYIETVFLFGVLFLILIRSNSIIRQHKEKESISKIKTKEEFERKSEELKIRASKIIKQLRILFISEIVFGSISLIIMLSSLFKEYANLQLNSTFNQRTNAIAPYIDDQQQKILNSKWALMKSKDEYIEIKHYIEKIAKDNNINLPKELIKY